MRHALIPLLLLTLAACATPTTRPPGFADAEWKAEQAAQAAAASKAPIAFNAKKNYGHKQVAALSGRLNPIARRIEKASASLCRDVTVAGTNCAFEVLLDPTKHDLNAHADGQNVIIYPAMVDFVRNDSQLGFVIAHEFAHNMMEHIDAQKQNTTIGLLLGAVADVAAGAGGINTQGAFGELGSSQGTLSYSSDFEAEADYVGLYILARAGFRIEEAPDLWRMMSQAEPDAIYIARSHPTNPARTLAMTKTVAEIRAKQRARQPLIPNIRMPDA
ncbi:MAG: M48 family metallopeptidase [Pseudomonadota bacterium]